MAALTHRLFSTLWGEYGDQLRAELIHEDARLDFLNQPFLKLSQLERAKRQTDQTIHRVVFKTLRDLLRRRLELGAAETYIDATNLTRRERRPYIKIAAAYGCQAEAVFFDTPLEVCLERNRARQRNVPEEVLRMMATKLQIPSLKEGFAMVAVISAGAAEG